MKVKINITEITDSGWMGYVSELRERLQSGKVHKVNGKDTLITKLSYSAKYDSNVIDFEAEMQE